MERKDLLLEVGTEEIPAAFLPEALTALRENTATGLAAQRIAFQTLRTLGTPRRLTLIARGVAVSQEERIVTKIGPAKSLAFDSAGNPTASALGFAKGQGIEVSGLKIIQTEKGEYVCAEKKEKSEPTLTLLARMLPEIILSLPFRKSMRWHDFELRFARPIHWVLALFGDEVVPFQLGAVVSGNITYGHRFLAPQPIMVTGIASYCEGLKNAFVLVDPDERRETLVKQIQEIAAAAGGVPDKDDALIEEVIYLTEYCAPLLCHFEKDFLHLPREVLVTTMKKHQKYFPVLDLQGNPLPYFIAVNNTQVKEPRLSAQGHERVLRARLSDARFFYTEDQKKSLDAMTNRLKEVIFQAQLGTSYEKVCRFTQLSLFITEKYFSPALKCRVERAAYLCKADLVSEMVGEFPELQGIMGREYARIAGEDPEVAEAIFEHYLPRFAEDRIPASDIGAIVGIADKLDTIVGCFGIGLVPSGTADPYGLRRQCLGIINIILGRHYHMSLPVLIDKSIDLLKDTVTRPAPAIIQEVLNFFAGRLVNLLVSQGHPADVVDAVIACGIDDITDMVKRITALQQFKQAPDFEPLAVAFKRVVNILSGSAAGSVDTSLFQHPAEIALYEKYAALSRNVMALMDGKEYLAALRCIATLRPEVDAFFDGVMVMVEDAALRNNRLAVLHEIASLFKNFADFTRLSETA